MPPMNEPDHLPPCTTRQDLFDRLEKLGITTRTVDHEPLFTVEQSSKVDLELAGAHTKNLFLKDAKGQLFLIIAHAATRVDLKGLPKVIGSARLSFGNSELMQSVLGVSPGSITAFAVINDQQGQVSVIIDKALMDYAQWNGHPLENTATTNIARDDLLRFIRATGHEPRIAVVDGASRA